MILVVALLVITSVRITPAPTLSIDFPLATTAEAGQGERPFGAPFRFEIPATPSTDGQCPNLPGLVEPHVEHRDPGDIRVDIDPRLQASIPAVPVKPVVRPVKPEDVC